jgi:hypothetical protein
MKKAISLLLAALMLAVAPLALADVVKLTENASGFDLTIDLPAGTVVSVEHYDDVPYTFVTLPGADAPLIYISVAPTEEYEGVNVGDLTSDEVETLFAVVSADMDSPSYTVETTDGGYPYLFVQDESETDSAMMILLEDGYFVQMSVWNANHAVLTDDDTATAAALLDTLAIMKD